MQSENSNPADRPQGAGTTAQSGTDTAQALTVLRAVHGHVEDYEGEVSALMVAERNDKPEVTNFPPSVLEKERENLERGLANENDQGWNIYYSAALLAPNADASERTSGRNLACLNVIVADLDTLQAANKCRRALETGEWPGDIAPSIVVQTSATPTPRYQVLYILDEPETELDAWRTAAAKVRDLWQADACTADPTHYWRLPGLTNWPNEKKRAAGRVPESANIVLEDTSRHYSAAHSFDHLPEPAITGTPVHTPTNHNSAIPSGEWTENVEDAWNHQSAQIRDMIANDPAGEDRSRLINAALWAMFDADTSSTEAFAILWNHPDGPAQRYHERAKGLWDDVCRVRGKWGAKIGNAQRPRLTAEQQAAWDAKIDHWIERARWKAQEETQPAAEDSSAAEGTPPQIGMTAADLQRRTFKPPRWIIHDLLPEGLTIQAGRPKIGKSWIGLDLCLAVAYGGVAFGAYQVAQGKCLYLALEDNPRRLQGRMNMLLPPGQDAPESLILATEWPRFSTEAGGLRQLDQWLSANPDCRLVVVDTWAKVKPQSNGNRNAYDEDSAQLSEVHSRAQKHGVAILVVHHLRKSASPDDWMEEISGSVGITGTADTLWHVSRGRGDPKGEWKLTGRDIGETELAATFNKDTGHWTVEGRAQEVAKSREQSEILDVLRHHGPLFPKEIADELGVERNNVQQRLKRLVEKGKVWKVGGKYALETQTNQAGDGG